MFVNLSLYHRTYTNMKICLRYLSPKNRHFVLLAAKVHRTICSIARDPLSERGLSLTSFKSLCFSSLSNVCQLISISQDVHKYENMST